MKRYSGLHDKLCTIENIEVVGFGECAVFKIANKYRYEILVRSKNLKELLKALHSIKSSNIMLDMDTIY